jgi:hypothetical protein
MADGCPLPAAPSEEHEPEEIPEVSYDRSLCTDAVAEGSGATDRHTR